MFSLCKCLSWESEGWWAWYYGSHKITLVGNVVIVTSNPLWWNEKNLATGKLMSKQQMINYVQKWKKNNKRILEEGGQLEPKRGHTIHPVPVKFVSGIFFSISAQSSASISSGCLSHEFWEVHPLLMLWYDSKLQHISSCICYYVWGWRQGWVGSVLELC